MQHKNKEQIIFPHDQFDLYRSLFECYPYKLEIKDVLFHVSKEIGNNALFYLFILKKDSGCNFQYFNFLKKYFVFIKL